MTVTDEQLGAFLDGECSETEAARIAALLESDADLAARLAQLSSDTQMLRGAFAGVLAEPLPAALTAAAAPPKQANVIDFVAARTARTPRWTPPLAIAASIALGVLVGAVGFNNPANVDGDGLILAANDGPVAGPVLATTLASTQSGTTKSLSSAAIKPILTFRDSDGRLCRQFSLQQRGANTNGIACQDGETWRLIVLATGEAPDGSEYVTAAGPADAAVAATIDSMIVGEPLDAKAEAEALLAAK